MNSQSALAGHVDEIRAAHRRIRLHIRRTPLMAAGEDLVLKCEALQVTGSFKPRGALNAALTLRAESPHLKGIIAVSSGNHAQAVALAGRTIGVPTAVVIPSDANPAKIAATRALGAEVITEGVDFANREAWARAVAEERGFEFVHPYDDWRVIHGQGTAALEVLQDRPDVDLMVVPIGGGGLAAGTALALKGLRPEARLVAVEPAAADDAYRAWLDHAPRRLTEAPETMADGVRTLQLGSRNFEVLIEKGWLDAVVRVSEAELAAGVVHAWNILKLALEPTGCLPVAAALAGYLRPYQTTSGTTCLLLSGGNFDARLVARLLST